MYWLHHIVPHVAPFQIREHFPLEKPIPGIDDGGTPEYLKHPVSHDARIPYAKDGDHNRGDKAGWIGLNRPQQDNICVTDVETNPS